MTAMRSTERYGVVVVPLNVGEAAKLVANDPVPEPVTTPVSVMVWSPVLVPDKLDPEMVPLAATDVGVIAPSVRVIAGVVVAVATEPLTPLAVVTETDVTVPLALPGDAHDPSARRKLVVPPPEAGTVPAVSAVNSDGVSATS